MGEIGIGYRSPPPTHRCRSRRWPKSAGAAPLDRGATGDHGRILRSSGGPRRRRQWPGTDRPRQLLGRPGCGAIPRLAEPAVVGVRSMSPRRARRIDRTPTGSPTTNRRW